MSKLTLLSATLALALTHSDVWATDAAPIRIGVPVGLTGANSVVAPSVVQAAELAVEEINAKGGVLGRKLALEIADDASGSAGARTAFTSLVSDKKVDVLISMETSAARTAGSPIASEGKVPYIYTSFYEGHACEGNLFVDAWVPEQQVPPVIDDFTDERGAKTFFLIGSDYAFGRGMLRFAGSYIEKAGGKVVGEEYLPTDGSDWTQVIAKLKRAHPDAIVTSTAGGSPNLELTRQLRVAGVTVPYANLALDEGTAKRLGSDASGVFLSASYLTGIASSANKLFLASMQKKFGADLKTPNDLSVPEYDAIYLYKAAVEKSGGTDPTRVLELLPTVSFDGPRGTIRMDKQHHARLTMYLGQVQVDGSVKVTRTFKVVEPGEQCPNLR